MINKYFPQKPKPIQLTQEKFTQCQKDEQTLQILRKEILIRLQTAREMGDLSENGAYTAAKSELRDTDRKLRLLERLLKYGIVVKSKNSGEVEFDSKVILDNGTSQLNFHLVSGFEADPASGKLSVFSPLGKAIMNKKINETVTVSTPNGKMTYTIISVK